MVARTLVLTLMMGCATVQGGGAVTSPAPGCDIEVTRGLLSPEWRVIGTRRIEGSVFLSMEDVERLARAEGCAAGAQVVSISSEFYGVPVAGSQAVVTLFRR